MTLAIRALPLAGLVFLGACATVPTGPSVLVLPGTGKTFDHFQADEGACRQYAYAQAGGVTANQAAGTAAVQSAVIGTAVGAAAGAIIGGSSGAAVGAGTGLAVGSVAGAGYASGSYYGTQQRYDYSYLQCMYAKGNRVPVSGYAAPGYASPGYPPGYYYPR